MASGLRMRSINVELVMLLACLGAANGRPEHTTLAAVQSVDEIAGDQSKSSIVAVRQNAAENSTIENVSEGLLRLNDVASAAAYRSGKASKSSNSRSSKSGGGKSISNFVWKDDIEDNNWNQSHKYLVKSAKRAWAGGDAWAASTGKTGKMRFKSGKEVGNKSGKSSSGTKSGKRVKSGKISTKSVYSGTG